MYGNDYVDVERNHQCAITKQSTRHIWTQNHLIE